MKAVNIQWDIDLEDDEMCQEEVLEECGLPTEVEIPDGVTDEEEISDWLSNEYGFCHAGFELRLSEQTQGLKEDAEIERE